MTQPSSIKNVDVQSTDTLYGADGTARAKLGIGEKTVTGITPKYAWQAIATHADGDTAFAASDGIAVVGGVDGSTVRKMLVDSLGRPLVVLVPTQSAVTDRSGTITTGGTSQQFAAGLTTRKYFFFQNHSDTDMWINFGVAAVVGQPSIKVEAGTAFSMEGSFCTTQTLNVMCATSGKAFTAKEA